MSRSARFILILCLLWAGQMRAGATDFEDLLNYHGTPANSTDRSVNIFFDSGAWHGYSLPPDSDTASGFVGPFVHSLGNGQWVGDAVGRLTLRDTDTGRNLVLTGTSSYAAPGYLRRTFTGNDLKVEQTLFYPDSWHVAVRNEISVTRELHLGFSSSARLMRSTAMKVSMVGDHIVQKFAGTDTVLLTRLVANGYTGKPSALSPAGFSLALEEPLTLDPDHPAVVYVEQTLIYSSHDQQPPALNYNNAWSVNRARWAGYLAQATQAHLVGLSDQDAQHVRAKAIVTLLGNWRAARGHLLHDGVVPSYTDSNYNGFWAWDSWKHVAALAPIAPDLARNQLLAMFDYQTEAGMVPDCIFLDKSNDNFRDSKPPLAAWAALRVFQATGDREFLLAIYDKLLRYHRWWSVERDHDHNGLAEYGSTDGTLIAAAWESGMDNAVRFDDSVMLRNGIGAWSADQESVDLNAYLFEEKRDLADIAGLLGKDEDRIRFLDEAEKLKILMQTHMFNDADGYFFDRKLQGGALVHVFGPEGWIPLWAGVANTEQAQRVAAVLMNPKKFATLMPLPSLAADDARFSPVTGYWRGAVWIDQAYFAVSGLRRYGFDQQANQLALRLVSSAKGLTAQTPFYEVYDPLTGTGLHAPNFSWSAAHYLMLLNELEKK